MSTVEFKLGLDMKPPVVLFCTLLKGSNAAEAYVAEN